MVSFDPFTSVYCPTCKKVQPARFDLVKANAYLDHDTLDIHAEIDQPLIAQYAPQDAPDRPRSRRL
jgi:hypothetical protein